MTNKKCNSFQQFLLELQLEVVCCKKLKSSQKVCMMLEAVSLTQFQVGMKQNQKHLKQPMLAYAKNSTKSKFSRMIA
jgi:hypothetical protein